MDKHNSPTPLHSTPLSQIVAICLSLFGLFLVLVSFLLGILVLATNTTSYNTWIITGIVAGIWLVWLGVTLFERFPPVVAAIRYANIISLPILGYVYLATNDMRYVYAGVSLFWCALLVEQAIDIHQKFATYYPGFRLLTLIGSWAMSVVALALTVIYVLPLSNTLSIISPPGQQTPTIILFMGYGFLSMLKKGMTPHTKGVVGAKSGHLQSADERGRVQPLDTLYVDVGAASADEVAQMGLRIGDPWVWLSELEPMTNPDRLVGKAIDNRVSCAVLLQLFRELQGATLDGTLVALVAVQEEVGLRGARVAAQRAAPDYAIVVDTFMSGDTPDVRYHREMPTRIGAGPVNLLANTGHLAHRGVARLLEEAAERAGVPLQPATVIGKANTDAAAIHLAREGIPTAGLGICRRYSHSPVELLDVNDAVGTVQVLVELCRTMGSAMQTIADVWA